MIRAKRSVLRSRSADGCREIQKGVCIFANGALVLRCNTDDIFYERIGHRFDGLALCILHGESDILIEICKCNGYASIGAIISLEGLRESHFLAVDLDRALEAVCYAEREGYLLVCYENDALHVCGGNGGYGHGLSCCR